MIFHTLNLIRIKDWSKNLLLLIPLVFSGQLLNIDLYSNIITAIIIFCLASSIIYILNDIKDISDDKIHSEKKLIKPLANGDLSIAYAQKLLVSFIFFLCFLVYLNNQIILHVIFYIILNLS